MMSSWTNMFKSKKDDGAEVQSAIKKLKDSQDVLQKKSEYLELKIAEQLAIAKKHVALQALGRKKHHEKQLNNVDNMLNTIDSHIDVLENAGTNVEIFKSMQDSTTALKPLDAVQKVVDDIAEHSAINDEILSVITTPINNDFDDDDLLKELEELEAETIEEALINVTPLPEFPDIPSSELPSTSTVKNKKTAEDDIGALAEWAN